MAYEKSPAAIHIFIIGIAEDFSKFQERTALSKSAVTTTNRPMEVTIEW